MGGEFDFGHAESQVPGRQFPVPRGTKQAVESEKLWARIDFGFAHCLLSSVYCNLHRGVVKVEESK